MASKLLGQKLLSGWCMRAEACTACGTPLVTAKGAPDAFVCVLCGPVPPPAAPALSAPAPRAPDAPVSAPSGGAGGPTPHQVLVKGLPFDADDSTLREVLGACGQIAALDILDLDGRSRGIARVAYATAAGAQKALALNGTDVGGRVISVSLEAGPEAPPSRSGGGGGSLLGHLRGYTGDEEEDDDDEKEGGAPLRRGGEGRGFDDHEEADNGGAAGDYSDAQWAEAFNEVRRGIDADAAGDMRRAGARGGAGGLGGVRQVVQATTLPPAPPPPIPAAAPAAARVSKADGNVGPSGVVQEISRVFVVPEPDAARVARLAAGLLLADAAEAQAEAAPAPTAAPAARPLGAASQPPSSGARPPGGSVAQPSSSLPTAAESSGAAAALPATAARAAASSASAALSAQLEREAALIASLQQPALGDASLAFLATAPVIAEAAGRIQKIAAAIAALQALLPIPQ